MTKKPKKPKKDIANIRVVVKMTHREAHDLKRLCENDVRTVGSWFRLQIHRAWAEHEKSKKRQAKTYTRNSTDGVHRNVDVWARLTDTERDQLDILADYAGVSVSIWFRQRLNREVFRNGAKELDRR